MAESSQLVTRASGLPALIGEESEQALYLAFGLGGEAFAMETKYVKEVLQYCHLTEVPLMPPFIRGVINLRGAVVPVVDLALRFGHPPTPVDRRTCFIILEVKENEESTVMGVMVDLVSEVLEINPRDIDPPPAFGNILRPEFLRGVGKIRGKFVLLLEMDRVLSLEELSSLPGGVDVGMA